MIGNLRLFSSVPTQAGPRFDRTQHRPKSTLGTLVGAPAINPFRSVARGENSSSHDDSFVFCVQCFTAALCRRVASQSRRIARRLFKSSAILELQSRICVSAVGGFQSCCRTWLAAAFGSNFLRTSLFKVVPYTCSVLQDGWVRFLDQLLHSAGLVVGTQAAQTPPRTHAV